MKKTIDNLSKAFIGESQARNRYTFYSKVARNEGFEQIADIFLSTADQEKEHANQLFQLIQELKNKSKDNLDQIKVEAIAPTIFGDTIENLKAAIAGEAYEFIKMYPEFAEIAEKENLPKVAEKLKAIANAEGHHKERYGKILKEVEAGTVFKKEREIWWFCQKCGYVHFGKQPPKKCPSCDHSRDFYQIKREEY